MAEEAEAEVLTGAGSMEVALDCDRDDPDVRAQALVRVLEVLQGVEAHLHEDLPRRTGGSSSL